MLARILAFLAAIGCATSAQAAEKPQETRLFELRIYTAAKGKLEDLHARFRDHTLKLFEKHGMTNIGYWVPLDNPEEKLYYLIAHKDKASRDASFKAFSGDPDWKAAAAASEKNGKITSKIESHFLTATDYSPLIAPSVGKEPRVFEMRTYTATKGNLDNLNARFRDHTLKLFEKHGIINLWYTTLAKGEKNDDLILIYMVAHKSEAEAKKSFDAFRLDPDWISARKASEEKGGGSLTAPDGVKSLFMKATDYSPTK
jgi:hypothetical protein